MITGMIIFSGSCYYQSITQDSTIRRITPYGGMLLIISWLLMILWSVDFCDFFYLWVPHFWLLGRAKICLGRPRGLIIIYCTWKVNYYKGLLIMYLCVDSLVKGSLSPWDSYMYLKCCKKSLVGYCTVVEVTDDDWNILCAWKMYI